MILPNLRTKFVAESIIPEHVSAFFLMFSALNYSGMSLFC